MHSKFSTEFSQPAPCHPLAIHITFLMHVGSCFFILDLTDESEGTDDAGFSFCEMAKCN